MDFTQLQDALTKANTLLLDQRKHLNAANDRVKVAEAKAADSATTVRALNAVIDLALEGVVTDREDVVAKLAEFKANPEQIEFAVQAVKTAAVFPSLGSAVPVLEADADVPNEFKPLLAELAAKYPQAT
jgi:hypothetical protein